MSSRSLLRERETSRVLVLMLLMFSVPRWTNDDGDGALGALGELAVLRGLRVGSGGLDARPPGSSSTSMSEFSSTSMASSEAEAPSSRAKTEKRLLTLSSKSSLSRKFWAALRELKGEEERGESLREGGEWEGRGGEERLKWSLSAWRWGRGRPSLTERRPRSIWLEKQASREEYTREREEREQQWMSILGQTLGAVTRWTFSQCLRSRS